MARAIYQLTTKNVQDIVKPLLDRKLSKEEMQEFVEIVDDFMSTAAYRSVWRALKEMELVR